MTPAIGDPDLGQRLATWLDDLGLGAHLSEAGLPTYARDDEGRAHWTDPVTGVPLTPEKLTQIDWLLRSQGDDPDHAVPLSLLQIARQARVRVQLMAGRWFTYETLAAVRGASVDATRFAVHKDARDRRLLIVAEEERTLVPAFQLNDEGAIRPDLEQVIAPLLAAGMDPWRAWAWLTTPAALLGGQVPERAVTDPDEAELVVRAAVHLAARVVSGNKG